MQTRQLVIATGSASLATFAEDSDMSSGRSPVVPDSSDKLLEEDVIESSWRRSTRLDVGLQRSTYASPLPAPGDLDRYAAHLSDVAERLLTVGEREQAHRHEIERGLLSLDKQVVPSFYAGQRRAHILGFVLGVIYLAAMVVAIVLGYPLMGVGGSAAGLAAVIWAVRRDPSTPPVSTGSPLAGTAPPE